jgi:hypothetical protein
MRAPRAFVRNLPPRAADCARDIAAPNSRNHRARPVPKLVGDGTAETPAPRSVAPRGSRTRSERRRARPLRAESDAKCARAVQPTRAPRSVSQTRAVSASLSRVQTVALRCGRSARPEPAPPRRRGYPSDSHDSKDHAPSRALPSVRRSTLAPADSGQAPADRAREAFSRSSECLPTESEPAALRGFAAPAWRAANAIAERCVARAHDLTENPSNEINARVVESRPRFVINVVVNHPRPCREVWVRSACDARGVGA